MCKKHSQGGYCGMRGLIEHHRCDSNSYQEKERESDGKPKRICPLTAYAILPLSTIVTTLRDQSVP